MAAEQTFLSKFDDLRSQAEEMLRQEPHRSFDGPSDFLELINELKIYQAELEIQNEELKRAQTELSELQQEYENLYEFAPCGYLTLDPAGTITKVNLTGSRLLATSRSILQYQNLSRFIDLGRDGAFLTTLRISAETGKKQGIDLPIKRENEPPLWVRAEIEADRDKNNRVNLWRVVLLDISAQRKAQEDKQKVEKQLRHAQKMESIGTLAGGVAHEFNNILTIILGYNELLAESKSNETKEGTEEIRIAGLRGRDVVRQLLLFSRKSDEKQSRIEIGSILQESIRLIRPTITANIAIDLNLSDDIDPILGNATQINQLLINLCSNAADAIQKADGTITITLDNTVLNLKNAPLPDGLKEGSYVKLTIADNGIGMEKKTLDRIFEPYFSTKDFDKGTGLGLAIVHGIVESHDGAIFVDSRPEKGSEFTILFPALKGSSQQVLTQPTDLPTGHERILYVEDDHSILKISRQRLERLGYSVVGFTDPTKALNAFTDAPGSFDLVITDMEMPRMTGDQLIVEILKIRPDTPTILCTGYSEKISEEKAQQLGISLFVLKPVEKETLAVGIRKVLDATD